MVADEYQIVVGIWTLQPRRRDLDFHLRRGLVFGIVFDHVMARAREMVGGSVVPG